MTIKTKRRKLKVGSRILVCRYPYNYICEVVRVEKPKINGMVCNYMVLDEYEELPND